MKSIKELLSDQLQGTPSIKDLLVTFDHIELTEEERDAAILDAKVKKAARIKEDERKARAEENRRQLIGTRWSVEQIAGFATNRAKAIFPDGFVLDQYNREVFDLLCLYFAGDQNFVRLAGEMEIRGASLEKGLLICGSFGTGKTRLMRLFSRNQRQSFNLMNARNISDGFVEDGPEFVERLVLPWQNPVNDVELFFQPFLGICIDDLGTEEVKNHYGNKVNVIADLIEKKYAARATGIFLHATTNLTVEEISTFYGGRVLSRMREIFNLIVLKGPDRRK